MKKENGYKRLHHEPRQPRFFEINREGEPVRNIFSSRIKEKEMGVSIRIQEFDKDRMNGKEKNPKQVLIDWVNNVQSAAVAGRNVIHNHNGLNRDQKLDKSSDYFERIIGQCETMMAVLNNSN